MESRYTLAEVLGVLEATRTRATYGAVAGVLRCSRPQLIKLLGARRPEVSWVVNAETGLPTGYSAHDLHRELQSNPRIIKSVAELNQLLTGTDPAVGARPGPSNPGVDRNGRTWRDFEKLVAEMYRLLGYQVNERGGSGPDGGVDIEIEKGGVRTVVQCKHWWRGESVGVDKVRELLGVMHHEHAHKAAFVTVGDFTEEARRFASANPVSLIDGIKLERCLRRVGLEPWKPMARVESQRDDRNVLPVSRKRTPSFARTFLLKIVVVVVFLSLVVKLAPIVSENIYQPAARQSSVTAVSGTRDPTPSTLRKPASTTPSPQVGSTQVGSVSSETLFDLRKRFKAQYRPPDGCETPMIGTDAEFVECVNHRIRERDAFYRTERGRER